MDHRSARRILVAAFVGGLCAQAFFYGTAIGLNLLLLVATVLVAAFLVRRPAAHTDRLDLWIAPSALAFGAFPALRADPALVAFDVLAAASLAAAAVAAVGGARLTRRSVVGLVVVAVQGTALLAGGAAETIRAADLASGTGPLRAWARRLGPVVRGLLIALPLLSVFVLLFSAADAVFSRGLSDLLSIELPLGEVPGRTALLVAVGWPVAGLLVAAGREVFAPEGRSLGAAITQAASGRPRLGLTEAVVVLGAVDLLFVVFVGLQVAYLFGGQDTLAATGMTYAEYARRGFFELVVVALMAGGLVAGLEVFVAGRSLGYLAAAVGLAGLTLLVLASAALRLKLYQDAYGWTELRFYVYAAIAWLGLGALATVGLLLTARTRWLAHALGVLAVVVALLVNAIGPQGFVARQDLARVVDPALVPAGGRSGLDVRYLSSLGDDAVPVMIDALPYLDPLDRSILETELRLRASALQRPEVTAWPAWNLAREQARAALAGYPAP